MNEKNELRDDFSLVTRENFLYNVLVTDVSADIDEEHEEIMAECQPEKSNQIIWYFTATNSKVFSYTLTVPKPKFTYFARFDKARHF